MAAIPVGLAEYNPATGTKKVFPLYANGSGEDTQQANFCTTRSYNPISANVGGTEYQVASFYDDPSEYVVIAYRSKTAGVWSSWTSYIMDGTGGRPTMNRNATDNHNTIGLGVDLDGYIWISWGMHANALLCRRSDSPLGSWMGLMSSNVTINAILTSVTYPHFFNDPDGNLYYMCRGTGTSGNGNTHVFKHSTGTTWASLTGLTNGLLIDGEASTGDESAYTFKPVFTPDFDGAGTGKLIIAWVWDDGGSRHDIGMVTWDGTDWETWAGAAQTVPITTSNDDIIDVVANALGLRGEEIIILDSSNRPHLIYKHYLTASTLKDALWHNYWNGSAWVKTRLDWGFENDYDWAAGDAVIDGDDVIHLLITNKTQGDGVYIFTSPGTSYGGQWHFGEFTDQSVKIGADGVETRAFVQFDPYQWRVNGVLQWLIPLAGDSAGANTAFPDGWDFADKATITNPASATDNPWFVIDASRLTARFWAEVQSDAGDVRLSDGNGNMLPCYVPSSTWNYAGEDGMIWGRWVGTLASSGTQEVQVHYGNATATPADATDILGRDNCWRERMLGVFLDGDGTDSSRAGNNLTATASPTEDQAGPFGSLKSSLLNGSTQYFSLTPASVSAALPSSCVEAWYNSASNSATQTIAGFSDTNDTDRYSIGQYRGATGGTPVSAAINANGAAVVFADSSVAGTHNAWHHVGFRFPSTTSRQVVLDGVAGTAETSTRSVDGQDCLSLGVLRRTTNANFFSGNIGPVFFYDNACPSVDELIHHHAMADQATFWGTWADANPATSGLLLANAAYFAGQM